MSHIASTSILIKLTMLQKDECPKTYLISNIEEKELYSVALKNKMVGILFHFLECDYCKHYLSKDFLSKIINYKKERMVIKYLLEKEKHKIHRVLLAENINYIFIKDLSFLTKIKPFSNFNLWGSDLDILVSTTNINKATATLLKNGYGIRNYPPHEVTLYNLSTNFNIDLHFLPSIPRDYFISIDRLKEFSELALVKSIVVDAYHYPSLEYQLCMLIISFWSNEFLRGLRSLYQIYILSKYYNREIDWELFFTISEYLHSKNISLVIILLSWKIFNYHTYLSLNKKYLPKRVKFVVSSLDHIQIGNFSLPKNWWDNQDPINRTLLQENFFLALITSEKTKLPRLLRIRVVTFLAKIILSRHCRKCSQHHFLSFNCWLLVFSLFHGLSSFIIIYTYGISIIT